MAATFEYVTMNLTTPLCVDLDGTLVHTDMLHETTLGLVKSFPVALLQLPLWLMQGKAKLKQEVAARAVFDASALPYNYDFLKWLRQQHAQGRCLVLCTASDRRIADAIASHLGVFDEVIATDG